MNDYYWNVVIKLETDYKDYGGKIERWDHPEESYFDCSSCVLYKKLDSDWGICFNPNSPRSGMLTYEHQAGHGCHKK